MLLAPSHATQSDLENPEPNTSRWKSKAKSSCKDAVPQHRICDEYGAYAVSYPTENLLVFCQTPRSDKTSSYINDCSIADVNKRIQMGGYFDDYGPTLAQVWVHHMFHYALKCKCLLPSQHFDHAATDQLL